MTFHMIETLNGTMTSDVFRTWGYVDPKTGEYTGLVGQLKRNEHDVGGLNDMNIVKF